MVRAILGDPGRVTEINRPISIFSIIFLAVIGPCVFIVQPGFVQGLVEYVGFSEQQGGYVAAAEMFGVAIATVLLNFIVARFHWRTMTFICLVLMIVGNFDPSLMPKR